MKILFDHQTFVYQRFGGISRYFTELVACFNKIKDGSASISALLSDNVYLKASEKTRTFSILNGHFPGSMTFYNSINRFVTKWKIRNNSYDIFHPTYYDTYFLDTIGDKPFVVTVYDMIHELYPGYWPNQVEVVDSKKKLLSKASGIIAISENTKNDILRLYPNIKSSKIKVIHLGNSFTPNNTAKRHVVKDYILFVGIRDHYKNFEKFLSAFHVVSSLFPNLHLVCAGGGIFTPKEMGQLTELGLNEAILYVPIRDDYFLAELYHYATLFVFPSLYEGFGIPILEAFASNCPIVLSHSSCFPEIAGNAAEYFDGNNVADMAQVLINLLNNDRRRNELRKLGIKRLELFSWEKTAQETIEFYQDVIKDASK